MAYHFGVMRDLVAKSYLWCLGVLACSGAAGCAAHPVQRQLSGRWIGDGVENVADGKLAAATGWAKGASLEFAGRHITVAIPAEEPRSAKYRVAAANGRDVKLEVLRPDGGTDPLSLKLDSDDRIRWMVGSQASIVLRRER